MKSIKLISTLSLLALGACSSVQHNVTGGLFSTAVGIAPGDILTDGDAFITPENSFV